MPFVVLFDVDGTLVLTGGAGRRAMARGFDAFCGRPEAMDGVELGGMTDRLIVRTALRVIGHGDDDESIEGVIAAYLDHLPAEVASSPGYRILPGAEAAVRAVSARGDVAVGLGTGNVREGARIKLARGGLDVAFRFGGFGCDHEDRVELLRSGAERGAAQLGVPLHACTLVVVGDTARDVRAANELGARSVVVGTGGHDLDALRALGAHAAFEDLTAPGVVDAIFSA